MRSIKVGCNPLFYSPVPVPIPSRVDNMDEFDDLFDPNYIQHLLDDWEGTLDALGISTPANHN